MTNAVEGLTFRKARAEDTERIAELLAGEPGQEAVAIAGCVEAARAFGMGLVRLPNSPQGWQRTTVAEIDGAVVGLVQAHPAEESLFHFSPRILLLALRTFGVGIVTVYGRHRARLRVEPPIPDGALHISELDVDPAQRNRGIGGALLDFAEAEARQGRYPAMSLHTTTINPARRLYERHGFRVEHSATDPSYKRYTGIDGRHLMVKELS